MAIETSIMGTGAQKKKGSESGELTYIIREKNWNTDEEQNFTTYFSSK